MFAPNDEGIEYPLQYKMYHGRHVICDANNRELFKLEVVRPSREAWTWIAQWAAEICRKFNDANQIITQSQYDLSADAIIAKDKKIEELENKLKEEAVKKKRGRPKNVE